MRSIAWILALSFALTSTNDAYALSKRQKKSRAKVLARQAAKSFKKKRYKTALSKFERANRLFPNPAFLFNIGQCHLFLEHPQKAVDYFERFLEARPDTPNRADVESLIADARAKLEPQPVPEPEPEPETLTPPITSPPEPEPAATPEPEPAATPEPEPAAAPEPDPLPAPVSTYDATTSVTSSPPAEDDSSVTEQWWFWGIIGAVAVGGAATAVVLAQGDTVTVLPSGDLGTVDFR